MIVTCSGGGVGFGEGGSASDDKNGPEGCSNGDRFLPEDTELFLPQDGIEKPTILIKNISINFGSFLSKVLAPVVSTIKEILAPAGFLIDPDTGFLFQEVKLLSWVMGRPMTVLDTIDQFMTGKFKKIKPFVEAVSRIYGIIKNIPTNGDDMEIVMVGCVAILGRTRTAMMCSTTKTRQNCAATPAASLTPAATWPPKWRQKRKNPVSRMLMPKRPRALPPASTPAPALATNHSNSVSPSSPTPANCSICFRARLPRWST